MSASPAPQALASSANGPEPVASLPVVETFQSLQGEGVHAGRGAFFIRLAGCAVGCAWCDTKHSWERQSHPHRTPMELAVAAVAAARSGAAFAVITGGEPLEHDLDPLCLALNQAVPQLPLHLETSGAAPRGLSGRFAWITLSPKRHRPPHPQLLAACDELKVVVHIADDLAFAEAMATQARERRGAAPALLLQPGWDSATGLAMAVDYVRQHPQWRLSLQSHKLLGLR